MWGSGVGAGGGGGMNWEIGIDMYTLICIKWVTNKNLLYKKINKIKLKNFKKPCKEFKHEHILMFFFHFNVFVVQIFTFELNLIRIVLER